MNEKLAKFFLDELIHTQTHLLALRIYVDSLREFKDVAPDKIDDEIRKNMDANKDAVISALKKRADHEGVSLAGLL